MKNVTDIFPEKWADVFTAGTIERISVGEDDQGQYIEYKITRLPDDVFKRVTEPER